MTDVNGLNGIEGIYPDGCSEADGSEEVGREPVVTPAATSLSGNLTRKTAPFAPFRFSKSI